MGDLLGGGDGGFEATQLPTLRPGQLSFLDLLSQQLVSQFQGGQLQGITPYGGTRPGEVPFGPLQQQAFGLAGGLTPGIQAGLGAFGQFDPSQGQGFLGQAQGALQRGLGFDPTQDILSALEPGRQLALRTFEQDIIPALSEKFGATSGPSGAFNRAITEAGAGLSLGLGAQAAPFLGQAALQQPGLQFQGAQIGGLLSGMPGQLAQRGLQLGTQGLGALTGLGGLQQQQARGVAGAEQQRFQEAQPFANPYLSQFGPLVLGTQAFENIVQPQGQGLASSILPSLGSFLGSQQGGFLGGGGGGGGGGSVLGDISPTGSTGSDVQLAMMIASMFSDERVKENIKPMDNALKKVSQLKGNTYNYTFDSPENRNGGIMAQDLQKILPDAVHEVNGVKMVRYDAVIGLLINAVNELARKVG